MAIEKAKKVARKASIKEGRILKGLQSYYKGECSLGYTAKNLKVPLRALMEFMTRHNLPYYWDEEDGRKGLERISQIRSNI